VATYVLVHAAWGGGWEWRRIARLLQARGHEAFTPTLTGLGERAHLTAPEIGLDTHVQDVVAVLEREDLRSIVLVGHSSAGMVITGVMDRVPDRIAHAVYLDAVVPEDGRSFADLAPSQLVDGMLRGPATRSGGGWLVPPPFEAEELGMSVEDADWYLANVVPHPLRFFEQPIALEGRWTSVPAITFVHCTSRSPYLPADEGEDRREGDSFLGVFARRARESGWGYRELPTGHDPHITDPGVLSTMLDELAGAGADDRLDM
jgi:pimeloyl-ACP methyl ester carboxylesterase